MTSYDTRNAVERAPPPCYVWAEGNTDALVHTSSQLTDLMSQQTRSYPFTRSTTRFLLRISPQELQKVIASALYIKGINTPYMYLTHQTLLSRLSSNSWDLLNVFKRDPIFAKQATMDDKEPLEPVRREDGVLVWGCLWRLSCANQGCEWDWIEG